jgi:hypothetical protein
MEKKDYIIKEKDGRFGLSLVKRSRGHPCGL